MWFEIVPALIGILVLSASTISAAGKKELFGKVTVKTLNVLGGWVCVGTTLLLMQRRALDRIDLLAEKVGDLESSASAHTDTYAAAMDIRGLLDSAFSISGERFTVAEVLSDVGEFHRCIERELGKTRSRWLITRISDMQIPPSQETAYFSLYAQRLEAMAASEPADSTIPVLQDVRRLVRIVDEAFCQKYAEMIRTTRSSSGFGIAVWNSAVAPASYDVIIGDEVVILVFGKLLGSNTGSPGWGLVLRGRAIADSFAEHFNLLWTHPDFSDLIKPNRVLDDREVATAEEELHRYLDAWRERQGSAEADRNSAPFIIAPARIRADPENPQPTDPTEVADQDSLNEG